MSDRHYDDAKSAPLWAKRCAHCNRLFRSIRGRKYGSNACRQAAYRRRLVTSLEPGGRNANLDPGGRNNPRAPVVTHIPLTNKKLNGTQPIVNGKRFRGVGKGGAT